MITQAHAGYGRGPQKEKDIVITHAHTGYGGGQQKEEEDTVITQATQEENRAEDTPLRTQAHAGYAGRKQSRGHTAEDTGTRRLRRRATEKRRHCGHAGRRRLHRQATEKRHCDRVGTRRLHGKATEKEDNVITQAGAGHAGGRRTPLLVRKLRCPLLRT